MAVALLSLASCSDDDETVYIDDTPLGDDNQSSVVFVCGPDQLGDITYNDEIYRGVVAAAKQNNLSLRFEILGAQDDLSIEDELDIFLSIQNMTFEGDTSKTLIVWCNDNFEPLLSERTADLTASPYVSHLLVESKNTALPINTMYFSLYGTCYQAGLVVSQAMTDVSSLALLSANPKDAMLAEMREGFKQGLADDTRSVAAAELYIDDEDGYNMADSAYRMAYYLDKQYQMVVPMCGGSVQGLLRYNREYTSSFYTVGLDCDMSKYSTRVPFSMTKSLATAIEQWIGRWNAGAKQEQHIVYGIDSGFCGITVSDNYNSLLATAVENAKAAAITKEHEYLNK